MRSSFAPVPPTMTEAEPEFMTQYKHLISILQLPAKSLKEADVIYSQIENHPYLKKFFGENISDKSAALQLCKNMSVQFFKRGDIVMAQGDQSDNKLYVILEGKVAIVINFKGPKPPDGAIYDIELEEKLDRERQESMQKDEDKIDEEMMEKIIKIFKKDKEGDKKKYIPFGEDPEMKNRADVNKRLNDLIENKNSVLKPRYSQKKTLFASSASMKPAFSTFLKIIKQKKIENQSSQTTVKEVGESAMYLDPEGFSQKILENSKKNSVSSPSDTPRARKQKEEQQEMKEKKFAQQIESFGTKVNEIGKGTGFGDKALLAPNPKQAVRNATIVATTPLLCIIVYRKDFLRVVENFSKEAIFKEKTITREFKFFKDVSSTSLKERLLYYFQDVRLLKNDFICKEGEEGDGFYILAEGKVTLQKKLEDQSNIYYQKYQNLSICTIERPTFFCEEIIFNKNDKQRFKYTIQVVSQNAHLFYCSKSNFIYKFPKDAIEELQQFHTARDISYSQLFDHCKEVQLSNEQLKKQSERSLNDNVHYMNYQQNKDLFSQMKNACIDYQVKKVIPKMIDQFDNQQTLLQPSQKIKLDEDYDPAIQDFCSKVDFVMKKNLEEREMVKRIITQKKIRTDKRTFKQKQSAYSKLNMFFDLHY